MKITIVQGPFFPVPPLRGGAVEKVWFALGKEFVRQGHAVTHISRQANDLPSNEKIEGVQHLRVHGYDPCGNFLLSKLRDLCYAFRALRKIPQSDVLVTNTFWLPVLLRFVNRGAIYVHVARRPQGQLFLYRHVQRLHTVSQPIRDAILAEAPWAEAKTQVIPYPLPALCETDAPPPPVSQRHKEILYAGRVHPEKGIGLLIDAFLRIRADGGHDDWRLSIVGPWQEGLGGGGNAYLEHLQRKAQPAHDAIHIEGPEFDEARLYQRMREAAVFAYPSLAEKGETFGLAVLEAMACGCAVVVSQLDCFGDFVEAGVNGLQFDHNGPEAAVRLSQSLTAITGAPGHADTLGGSAITTAKSYTLKHVAVTYLQDLEKVTLNT